MCVPWENKFPQNNNYNLSLPVMMHAPQYLSLPLIQGPPNANLKCDYYCAWPTVCVWGHLFGGFGGPPPPIHSYTIHNSSLSDHSHMSFHVSTRCFFIEVSSMKIKIMYIYIYISNIMRMWQFSRGWGTSGI